MAIKLLSTIGTPLGEVGDLGADSTARISHSLESSGARLLRVWEPSLSDSPGLSPFLVVRDPPELGRLAGMLAGERLQLQDTVTLVPIAPTGDLLADLDAIERGLPQRLPQDLFAGGLIAPSLSEGAVLGLAFCPDCGGWGKHLYEPCPPA